MNLSNYLIYIMSWGDIMIGLLLIISGLIVLLMYLIKPYIDFNDLDFGNFTLDFNPCKELCISNRLILWGFTFLIFRFRYILIRFIIIVIISFLIVNIVNYFNRYRFSSIDLFFNSSCYTVGEIEPNGYGYILCEEKGNKPIRIKARSSTNTYIDTCTCVVIIEIVDNVALIRLP